jgi:rRNA-processing protein FCF1
MILIVYKLPAFCQATIKIVVVKAVVGEFEKLVR